MLFLCWPLLPSFDSRIKSGKITVELPSVTSVRSCKANIANFWTSWTLILPQAYWFNKWFASFEDLVQDRCSSSRRCWSPPRRLLTLTSIPSCGFWVMFVVGEPLEDLISNICGSCDFLRSYLYLLFLWNDWCFQDLTNYMCGSWLLAALDVYSWLYVLFLWKNWLWNPWKILYK